ncbi:MAG: hypothetical protein HW416_3791 [Chloroflexi bacterium]|nr:hypothetical protein [Chloroflexota bacterium]
MKLDFLKERYEFELDRKEKLTAALTLPVGVLSLLGGALTAMARSFTYKDLTVSGFFLVFLVAAVLSFFICAYRLMRAYHAQTYIYLPLLSEFETFEEEDRQWRAYVEATGGDLSNEEDFDSWLRKRIINAADANTRSNDQRAKWLHQSRSWLFAVFCFTAVAGIPYAADQVRFRMATQTDQTPKPAPAAQAQLRPPAPPRPSFPENRVIKEGTGGNTEKK